MHEACLDVTLASLVSARLVVYASLFHSSMHRKVAEANTMELVDLVCSDDPKRQFA